MIIIGISSSMGRTTLAALLVLVAASSGLLCPSSCLTTGGLSADTEAQGTIEHHQCTAGDLQRARQQVPRAPWKGPDFAGMSRVLTAKLTEAGHVVTPCEKWSIEELKDLQRTLFSAAEPELLEVYEDAGDNRRRQRRFRSLEALEAHWEALDRELEASAHREWLGAVRRDGLCHEAVMWFVHHLPEAQQRRLMTSSSSFSSSSKQHHNRTLPSLPETLHQGPPGSLEAASAAVIMQPQPRPSTHPGASGASAPESKVLAEYSQQVSCQQCHTGTIDDPKWRDAELPEPLPVDKVHPGRERVRSCDFQARPPCGPCEGLGGVRWGDGPEDMTPMRCDVVHWPHEAPPITRGRYPDLAVASMSFETRSPLAVRPEGDAKYVKLRGTLTLGWNDTDDMMRMRYDLESSEGAALRAALYMQSATQAKEMDPGVTGSISPEHCSCGRSIAGVMHTLSFDPDDPLDPLSLRPDQGGAAYLGRVNVELDGDTSLGRRNATADHFMKWAFHFLVDADESSPTFGLPLRLYAPWGVREVFEGWTLGDPAERDPGVWKLPPGCERLAPGCSLFHEDGDGSDAAKEQEEKTLLGHPARASSASSGSSPRTNTE